MANAASPPWVLFSDKGKPVAILPAGRPGEVAKVGHLTMRQARDIVNLANRIHDRLVRAKLDRIEAELTRLLRELAACSDTRAAAPEDGGRDG